MRPTLSFRKLAWLLVATSVAGSAAAEASAAEAVEATLRRQTQELMDAVAPGRVEVWQRYLHENLLSLDENGAVADKAKLLTELTPLPPGLVGTIAVDTFRVSLVGEIALAAGEIQERLDYHGQLLHTRFRFLDTWLHTADGWRLVGHHTEAVLKDPPAVALTPAELCAYAGTYELTPEIRTVVRCGSDGLVSERTGRPATAYRSEVRDLFFTPGQPRSRRLVLRAAAGGVAGFADRREGEDIVWRRIADAPG